RLAQLVANLQTQFELFGVVRRGCVQTRVGFDIETLRQRLPVDLHPHLVSSGRELWTTHLARPQDQVRETNGVSISGIPDETIEPDFRRRRRCLRRTETAAALSSSWRCRRFTRLRQP